MQMGKLVFVIKISRNVYQVEKAIERVYLLLFHIPVTNLVQYGIRKYLCNFHLNYDLDTSHLAYHH